MFSVLGSEGFIGSQLVNYLEEKQYEYKTPNVDDERIFDKDLGDIIYCIGITADFRKRPFDTVESHVCLLQKILKKCKFNSLLYLSSSRVYLDSKSTNENSDLIVNPTKFENIYNISKLMGESICIGCQKPRVRIVRLSNVVGNNSKYNDFLPSIIFDVLNKKKIVLNLDLNSEKDYVHVDDVVKLLPEISLHGKQSIYNVASGKNTKIKEIIQRLEEIMRCKIQVLNGSKKQSFQKINIKSIEDEFNFQPINFLDQLDEMMRFQKERLD